MLRGLGYYSCERLAVLAGRATPEAALEILR